MNHRVISTQGTSNTLNNTNIMGKKWLELIFFCFFVKDSFDKINTSVRVRINVFTRAAWCIFSALTSQFAPAQQFHCRTCNTKFSKLIQQACIVLSFIYKKAQPIYLPTHTCPFVNFTKKYDAFLKYSTCSYSDQRWKLEGWLQYGKSEGRRADVSFEKDTFLKHPKWCAISYE